MQQRMGELEESDIKLIKYAKIKLKKDAKSGQAYLL